MFDIATVDGANGGCVALAGGDALDHAVGLHFLEPLPRGCLRDAPSSGAGRLRQLHAVEFTGDPQLNDVPHGVVVREFLSMFGLKFGPNIAEHSRLFNDLLARPRAKAEE